MATQGAIQIQVTINGQSLSIEKKNLVSLNIKRVIGDAANEFTLEAFDETAWQLENALMSGDFAPISVSYSAANDLKTKTTIFTGVCYDYQVTFAGRSTMISITGILSATGTQDGAYWFDRNSILWSSYTPEYRGPTGDEEEEGRQDPNNWYIDDRAYSDWSNYENNEDICAILSFDGGKDENGEQIVSLSPIVYHNPTRIFKRIMHVYNGDQPNAVEKVVTSTSLAVTYRGGANVVSSSSSGKLGTVNNTSDTCWNYLNKMYGPYVAAGIMGNIMQECSMNYKSYNNVSGGHYGLCQWSRRYYPQMWGAALTKQLEYIPKWINAGYNTYHSNYDANIRLKDFLALKDERKVAEAFCVVMERPGKAEAMISQRQAYATGYLNKYNVNTQNNTKARGAGSVTIPSTTTTTVISDGKGTGWKSSGKEMFKIGKTEKSKWVSGMQPVQTNETAAQFITRVLCKSAMTDTHKNYEDETAGFQYFVNANGHNFIPLDYNSNSKVSDLRITYGMQNSNIISFSISKVGATAMCGGPKDKNGRLLIETSSMSYLFNENITVGGETTLNSNVSSEIANDNLETQNWWSAKVSTIKTSSSSTTNGLNSTINNFFKNMSMWTINAELTVWATNNNEYAPGKYIDITIMSADGKYKHYSSGSYYILEMTDNISGDGYTQTMKLMKLSEAGKSEAQKKSSGKFTIVAPDGTIIGSDNSSNSGGSSSSSDSITSLTPTYRETGTQQVTPGIVTGIVGGTSTNQVPTNITPPVYGPVQK